MAECMLRPWVRWKLPWVTRVVTEDRALASVFLEGEERRRGAWWRRRRNREVRELPRQGVMEIEGSFPRRDRPAIVPDTCI